MAEKLFLSDEKFIAPKFAIVELFKYKEKIIKFSKMPEEKVLHMLHLVLKQIQFFDVGELPKEDRINAIKLCKDIDEKDAPFLALALNTNGKLWTSDKKLIKGLKAKGFSDFFE